MIGQQNSIRTTDCPADICRQYLARLFALSLAFVLAFTLQIQDVYAQNIIKDFLKDNQVIIDPNAGKLVIKPKVACLIPMKPNAAGTKCICPAPNKWVNGKCTAPGPQIACLIPMKPNAAGTKCICPAPNKWINGQCRPPLVQILCKAPFVPSNSGTKCVCPAGLRKSGNTCVPKAVTISCNFPFVYSSRRNSCVCAKGYRLNNAGNKCIRKQAAPVVPRAVIREIQACLANLGYQPGPVDGAIGRKTRNAWAEFRVDEGLTGRPNTFADEVTQDRLFVACANANQNAQSDPEPTPQPEPDPQDSANDSGFSTNFDPDKGYPTLQCVSRSLVPVFAGLLSDGEEPKICGEACVPIPSGMTAGQIEQTGASVNWCRNCADLGNGNLVCTGDHVKEDDSQN